MKQLTSRRDFLRNASVGVASLGMSEWCLSDSRGISITKAESPIAVDVGRQLFVDDFLISECSLSRTSHAAQIHEHNPVLTPETALEMNDGLRPVACPFDDGVFYDPRDRLFKMWYHAGWFDGVAYATSEDGLNWQRPDLDIQPGTNRVLARRAEYRRDGATVWLDSDAKDPAERFKMFVYFRTKEGEGGHVYTSPDGIHWNERARTSPCGDNTCFYLDPFRKKWIYSIRSYNQYGRVRSYWADADFIQGWSWPKNGPVEWLRTDALDMPDPELGYAPQLYKFSAVAYESLMMGVFAIFKGPPNELASKEGVPKTIDMTVGFSRDGFHWNRLDHKPFLACSRIPGTWNRGYLHSAGGICLVVRDKLHFYFGAFSGVSPKSGSDIYSGASTGLAILRRDGFASLDAGNRSGTVTTKPILFRGDTCL